MNSESEFDDTVPDSTDDAPKKSFDLVRARTLLILYVLFFMSAFSVLSVRTVSLALNPSFDPLADIWSKYSSDLTRFYIAAVIFGFLIMVVILPNQIRNKSAAPHHPSIDVISSIAIELRGRLNTNKRNILVTLATLLAASFSTQKINGEIVMQFGTYSLPAAFFYFAITISAFWFSVTHNHITGQLQDVYGNEKSKATLVETFGTSVSSVLDYWLPCIISLVCIIVSGILLLAI